MDAQLCLTDEVIDAVIAYGGYGDFPVETAKQVKEGYLKWIGFASSYDEEEEVDLPIGPGHRAWQILDVVFDSCIDWERVQREIAAYLDSKEPI